MRPNITHLWFVYYHLFAHPQCYIPVVVDVWMKGDDSLLQSHDEAVDIRDVTSSHSVSGVFHDERKTIIIHRILLIIWAINSYEYILFKIHLMKLGKLMNNLQQYCAFWKLKEKSNILLPLAEYSNKKNESSLNKVLTCYEMLAWKAHNRTWPTVSSS